jgi:tRNA 2-thiouridine synthesizing protein A
MSQNTDPDTSPTQMPQVDAIGLLCPLPVLRARKALESLPPGAEICVLASDPAAIIDMPHFCAQSGHDFLGMTEADDHTIYHLRKGASRT